MHLFAQVAPGVPPPNFIWAALAGVAACYLVVFLLVAVVGALFLRTLARTLDRCSPDLRLMEPGSVWLNLIPFFNVVWLFVTVIRVGDSLRLEFADRQLDEDEDGGGYGKTLGLAGLMLVLFSCGACCLPLPLVGNNAFGLAMGAGVVRLVVFVAVLVVFVLYWVRVAGYGRQLADDDDDRYDAAAADDRPPPEEPIDDRSR